MKVQKQIDEINALDKARTQGEWVLDGYLEIDRYVKDNFVVHTEEDCVSESGKEDDAAFIAKAPEMVIIINAQAEMLEKMEKSLEYVLYCATYKEITVPAYEMRKDRIKDKAKTTLKEYKAFKESK